MITNTIKDRYHNIIGFEEVKDNGDKVMKDRYHNIVGFYFKAQNVTKDRYHNLIAHGDVLSSLIR